jgi:hypothetical protein
MQGEDEAEHGNAARQCAAQQADLTFVAGHGGLTFTQVYERNPGDAANAFGRCVNLTAHQHEAESPADGADAHGDGSGSSTSEGSAPSGPTSGTSGEGSELTGGHGSQASRGSDG